MVMFDYFWQVIVGNENTGTHVGTRKIEDTFRKLKHVTRIKK